MVALAEGTDRHRHKSASRRLHSVSVDEILSATASHHGVDASQYAVFRSSAAGRDMAAWLCRRWTGATLAELGPSFGLTGTDSVSNLARRAEKRHKESAKWRKTARLIVASLGLNTEPKA
jgi:chromosomal replication initiation ATPase DnaA